jgi:hypothetical protein
MSYEVSLIKEGESNIYILTTQIPDCKGGSREEAAIVNFYWYSTIEVGWVECGYGWVLQVGFHEAELA